MVDHIAEILELTIKKYASLAGVESCKKKCSDILRGLKLKEEKVVKIDTYNYSFIDLVKLYYITPFVPDVFKIICKYAYKIKYIIDESYTLPSTRQNTVTRLVNDKLITVKHNYVIIRDAKSYDILEKYHVKDLCIKDPVSFNPFPMSISEERLDLVIQNNIICVSNFNEQSILMIDLNKEIKYAERIYSFSKIKFTKIYDNKLFVITYDHIKSMTVDEIHPYMILPGDKYYTNKINCSVYNFDSIYNCVNIQFDVSDYKLVHDRTVEYYFEIVNNLFYVIMKILNMTMYLHVMIFDITTAVRLYEYDIELPKNKNNIEYSFETSTWFCINENNELFLFICKAQNITLRHYMCKYNSLTGLLLSKSIFHNMYYFDSKKDNIHNNRLIMYSQNTCSVNTMKFIVC